MNNLTESGRVLCSYVCVGDVLTRAECCFDLRVERSPMGEQPQRAFMCALETLKCLTSDLCFSVWKRNKWWINLEF